MLDTQAFLIVVILFGTMLAASWIVRRMASTTLDFYLAGRQVGPFLNACAICGDYFSAASFLGVAGAVYVSGLDGVWFATGFAAGFVVMLLFLAAPLRRAGRFSIPDFLASRFGAPAVRVTAVCIVQLVVLMYLLPQMAGAGLTWEVLVGDGLAGMSPYATGIVLSTVAITLHAVVGGMRATTWNQALQFGFLFFTVFLLAAIVTSGGFSYPAAVEEVSREPLGRVEVGAGGAAVVPAENHLHPERPPRFSQAGHRYTLGEQAGLIVTLLLGTAGLPHIVNRYFTSTSGRAARRSTVWVLGLAGGFYGLAIMLGVAARTELSATGGDFVDGVARVPEQALLLLAEQLGGDPLLAMVAAAALAAIFSTVAGLLIAAATSWGHDVYEQFVNPGASERRRIFFGRVAVAGTAVAAAAFGILVQNLEFGLTNTPSLALMVTWAFAVAGSAFTPVFLLSVWWKRMTARGVIAGMIVGASVSLALIGYALIADAAGLPRSPFGSFSGIVGAPAAAAAAMAISLRERHAEPSAWWMRIHGTARERRQALLARLAARGEAAP